MDASTHQHRIQCESKHARSGWSGSRSIRILHILIVGVVAGLWCTLLILRQPQDGLWTDFYPIYYAGQALRAGLSPYGPEVSDHLRRIWHAPFAAAGVAYPLPAIVTIWPLLFLPLPLAGLIWTAGGALCAAAAISLRSKWQHLRLLPFCFMPLWFAVNVRQATLIWFAFIVILIWAMRRSSPILAGLMIALLPGKPQTGLLFALAGILWAWQHERRALLWAGAFGLPLWGVSFALQPRWIQEWLASVTHYNALVHPVSLLPWGLLLLVATLRLPWYAQLGVAQVVLFPITDVYSTLPLMLTWVGIGGPLSLLGSSISWLEIALGITTSVKALWMTVMIPLGACALWRFYTDQRYRSPSAPSTDGVGAVVNSMFAWPEDADSTQGRRW